MRLSLRKGAHAASSSAMWQEIRVRSGRDDKFIAPERLNCRSLGCARDDKREGGAAVWCDGSNDNRTDVVHSRRNLPQAGHAAPDEQKLPNRINIDFQRSFLPSTCRRQVRLLLVTQGADDRVSAAPPALGSFNRFPSPSGPDVWQSALRALQGWVRNNPTKAKRRLEWASHLLLVQRVPVSFLSQLAAGGASIGRVGGNDNSRTLFIPDETCRQV